MSSQSNDPQRWLRNSLLGNAAFSTLSGASFALAGGAIAEFLGIAEAALVRAIGVGLLGFAGYVAYTATRESIDLRAALGIVAGDLAWVAATIPVVLLGLLSQQGAMVAAVIADVVFVFAGLQYYGVRRIRSLAAPVEVTS